MLNTRFACHDSRHRAADCIDDVHRAVLFRLHLGGGPGSFLAGVLIDALGKDYGIIFLIAPITLVVAFVFMLGVRRGECAEIVAQ